MCQSGMSTRVAVKRRARNQFSVRSRPGLESRFISARLSPDQREIAMGFVLCAFGVGNGRRVVAAAADESRIAAVAFERLP